jgi:hypothetical protein
MIHTDASSYDRRSNIVDEYEANVFGLPKKYEYLHQEKAIFVDKTGENTTQKKNGNISLPLETEMPEKDATQRITISLCFRSPLQRESP